MFMQTPILSTCRHESKVIHKLVMEVVNKLDHQVSNIKEDLVGIDSRVDEVKLLLELGTDDVRFIGIWGMGGIGKTTVASALFDNISHQFESAIFIHGVREKSKKYGLENLQEIMISKILRQKDVKVHSISQGMQWISGIVCRKKALVILDDVDNMDQVNALVGNHDCFGQGSRIIITTRDRKILGNTNVAKIHEVGLLGVTESVKLFNLNAFKKIHHPKEFEELSRLIVEYAGGLPLALKVLGTFLYGRDIEMWKSAVDRLRDIPEDDIIEKLKVSFDHGLKLVEQEIFLDIACFLKGEKVDYAKQVLDSFGFYSGIGIPVLVEKSLIVISKGKLQMHDLIQEMGWHIVRQVHPRQPGKYNRLWDPQEVHDVLTQNTGTEEVEGLQLDLPKPTEVDFSSDALKKMDRLRLLKFRNVYFSQVIEYLPNQLRWLYWHGYPSKSLPATFKAANLVGLDLFWSHLEQFWPEGKRGNKLKFVNLAQSQELTGTPDFSDIPNLQKLVLESCTSLQQVHQSIAFHKNLVLLNLKGCINLRSLPDKIQLVSLERLILSSCIRLDKFPDIQGDMNNLSELYLNGTAIKELPLSVKCLKNLVLIELSGCRSLRSLPGSICSLRSLRFLNLSGCSELCELPGNLGNLGCLEELHADNTTVIQLPTSIRLLKKLKILSFTGCKNSIVPQLRRLPVVLPLVSGLSSLVMLYLGHQNLTSVPYDICYLSSLLELDIGGNNFVSLPSSMAQIPRLEILWLVGCKKLQVLPELPPSITGLYADDCVMLQGLAHPLSTYTRLLMVSLVNCSELVGSLADTLWQYLQQSASMFERIGGSTFRHRGYTSSSIMYAGRDIPGQLGNENMGRSISMELPPQWCSANFLGFVIYDVVQLAGDFTRHPLDRRRTHFIRMKVRVESDDNLEECFMIRRGIEISSTVKVGPMHLLLAYLRFGHVFSSTTLAARIQPNNCRLIEFLLSDVRFLANSEGWIVQKGGGRLIYKEDVMLPLEDQMMVCRPSNHHSPIIEGIHVPSILPPCPPRVQPINSDTTATTEFKPPTHPGDHPTIQHRPGKEPAQSITTTYTQYLATPAT
ncbi:hypothetical protein RJ640_015417 [Escallonia rubra]|uniref:ADP-ribosyl cyclase/cyclic ADP-ribose hydrolase n=1 Tax=Escallonia rubra TaxID=112253 RepID=A0AA88RD62_9ASTE|nr:hypothetical protein RJ640_015417 [Escallonia rubra]